MKNLDFPYHLYDQMQPLEAEKEQVKHCSVVKERDTGIGELKSLPSVSWLEVEQFPNL